MTGSLLVLVLLAAGDAAPAGAAYARGLEHLEARRFDEAVTALEEALRHSADETPALKYRNEQGRNRHAYYPQYALARARLGQAEKEPLPYVKRERLQAALRGFTATAHADGAARAEATRKTLEALEKAIAEAEANAVPPELTALKAKVDRLCEAADFEGGFKELADGAELLAKYPKVRNDLLNSTRNRQQAAIRNYDTILGSRLDSISRTDPTYEADVVLPLLKPARVPPEVAKDPPARFKWLAEMCEVFEKHLASVKGAASLAPAAAIETSGAFEALAGKALAIDLVAGYRASRNMAHAIRMARLREYASAADRVDSDLPGNAEFTNAVGILQQASQDSHLFSESAVAARTPETPADAEELKKYREVDLPYHKRQIDAVLGKLKESSIAYERRVEADSRASKAEQALSTPAVMSSPEACRKAGQELSVFESQAWFETLPAPARARVLFARAISEAVASFLEGEPAARVAERCRADALRAYGLDGAVAERWTKSGRLSPRLSSFFERMRKP